MKNFLRDIPDIFLTKTFKKNEFLFMRADKVDSVYILIEGICKETIVGEKEKEVLIDYYENFGIFGCVDGAIIESCTSQVKFLAESKVIVIPRRKYFYYIKRNPDKIFEVFFELTNKLKIRYSKINDLRYSKADSRLLSFFAEAIRNMQPDREGYYNIPRLKQSDLAEQIGVSRETITKLFKKFSKGSFLIVTNELFRIKNYSTNDYFA